MQKSELSATEGRTNLIYLKTQYVDVFMTEAV